MTRGRNDSGRKGKWAKRLGGERESGRNDPDSFDLLRHASCQNNGIEGHKSETSVIKIGVVQLLISVFLPGPHLGFSSHA